MIENLSQKVYRTLRWSEKYLKTDMVYMAKGGFWLGVSQVLSSLASLLLVVAFTNLISVELYGKYHYVVSIIGILAIATFPGINSVAIKTVAAGETDVFWGLIRKKTLWSLLAALASLVTAAYYLIGDNTELALVFVIAAVGIPLSSVVGSYAAFLTGEGDFRRLAIWSTLAKVVVVASMVAVLPWIKSLAALFLLFFIPEAMIEGWYLFKLYRQERPGAVSRAGVKKLSDFGLHLSIMEVFKTVAGQIDKILVFHYLGAVQLAIYAVASAAPSQIKSVLQNITTLALPKFSQTTEAEVRDSLPAKLFKLELIILAMVAAYWIVAPWLFPLVFPKYASAVFISQVYSLSLVFFPRTFFTTAMVAHLKQKEMYAIRLLAPAVRIAVFLVALPFFGLWGAIVGSIIANGLTAFVYQYFFRRAFRVKII